MVLVVTRQIGGKVGPFRASERVDMGLAASRMLLGSRMQLGMPALGCHNQVESSDMQMQSCQHLGWAVWGSASVQTRIPTVHLRQLANNAACP